MSAAAGIGASFGSNGTSIGFTASASVGKGKEDGKGTTQLNSHVMAGKQLAIESGGDTNIKGAVASGEQVVAKVGGDLNIESLQDTATFDSKNQSLGVSGTFGMGVSVSASFSDSKLSSDYASVQEQSGIRAGAGGFQLVVDGNTDLKGAVISSSQEAIDAGKNSLTTGSLTVRDIANHADYKGHSVGLSGGLGTEGDSRDAAPDTSGVGGDSWKWMQTGGSGMNAPIALGASGNDSSTTVSGISGGVVTITNGQQQQELTDKTAEEMLAELNRDVSNEKDTSGRIENNFDQASIQAGFEIVGAFTRQVSTFIADKSGEIDSVRTKAENLDAEADALTAKAEALPDGQEKQRLLDAASSLIEEATAKRIQSITLEDQGGGAGGTYRQIATAFTAAAAGDVSGATNEFIQRSLVNWAQSNIAGSIKQLAEDYGLAEGFPAHVALHAKRSKDYLSKKGSEGLEKVGELLEKLEIGELKKRQKQISDFLDAAAATGGLTDGEIAALGILYAANEALFPTGVLDVAPGLGKAVRHAGTLIKSGVRAEEAARVASTATKIHPTGKIQIDVASGSKGDWSNEINKPQSNTVYNIDNRYQYHTDNFSRVERVEGDLSLQTVDRNTYQQCVVGKCGSNGDEGGHLIAAIFSGPGERLNLVPMNGNLNKGEWRKLENEWAKALNENKTVSVDIRPVYMGDGRRPDMFEITYIIEGKRPETVKLKNSPGGV